jgi:hypothetical protein
MKMLWTAVLALLAYPAWAQDWKVDYGRSEIRFVIKQMNVPVDGGFKRFNVQAVFDPSKPELARFRVEVDVAQHRYGLRGGRRRSQAAGLVRRGAPSQGAVRFKDHAQGRSRPFHHDRRHDREGPHPVF